MLPAIEIESVWEDESLFEVRIKANNGKFAAEACCYTLREEISQLADSIKDFPKSLQDKVEFSTYGSDNSSYFSLNFNVIDGSGHIVIRVKIAEIHSWSNKPKESNVAEFDMPIESVGINQFSSTLNKLSKAGIGEIKAVMNGKT